MIEAQRGVSLDKMGVTKSLSNYFDPKLQTRKKKKRTRTHTHIDTDTHKHMNKPIKEP